MKNIESLFYIYFYKYSLKKSSEMYKQNLFK